MTEALYLKDSYLKEFEAVVESVSDGKFVVLNQTAFYPASGGQPFDEGIMVRESDGREFKVIYVGKFYGNISHQVELENSENTLKSGDKVKCKIDWERRYPLMKLHTATHILSEVLYKETHADITGGQMGLDKSRMDFALDDYDLEKIKSYIDKANEILKRDLKISVEFLSKEEAMKIPKLSKLAKSPEEIFGDIEEIRIVNIGDFDIQADGGTHVNSTSEVGEIEFIKCDNKGKNNRRIYYKLK
jgi:misacylated tRNA(Ala) deacylase